MREAQCDALQCKDRSSVACRKKIYGKTESHVSVWPDSNNMQGSLLEDICLLDSLERLIVAHNQLEGTIPSCLGSHPTLVALEVEGNPILNDENAVSDPLFCDNDRLWDIFVVDCSMSCDCCTSCE
jgi:hypothetical protein